MKSKYDSLLNRGRDYIKWTLFHSLAIRPLEIHHVLERSINAPIFIIGAPRSGTTVLSHLLQNHPSIMRTHGLPDGEDTKMWVKYADVKMAGIGGRRAYQAIGSNICVPMGKDDFDENRARMLRYYLWCKYQAKYPHKWILNKNPHLTNKLSFVKAIFSDAKFIHLIREPFANIASLEKMLLVHYRLQFVLPEIDVPCWSIYPASLTLNEKETARRFKRKRFDLLVEYWWKINAGVLAEK